MRGPLIWGWLGIVGLIAFSEYLSLNRIYQVDELEAVFNARLIATREAPNYLVGAPLMVLGPMTWLAAVIARAAILMRVERLLFLLVFWTNLVLVVQCAGFRLRSSRGVCALMLVATLAPLWDYGFEIRHDNLGLTAILMAWKSARPLQSDRRRILLLGFLCAIAQFLTFKAFAYMIPIAMFAVVAARVEERRPLFRSAVALLAGAAAGVGSVVLIHWMTGTWAPFMTELRSTGEIVSMVTPFTARFPLSRLVHQSPLLVVIAAGGFVYSLRDVPSVKTWFSRESLLPEAALLIGAIAAILANPTPFPYNLVLLVPQAAILCLRLEPLAERLWRTSLGWQMVLLGCVFVHGLTWLVETRRHLVMTNARQAELMTLAEDMTDPKQHAVLDGTGFVPTRNPPNRYWLIHSFTVRKFENGDYPSIPSQLAEGRTAVIIPNYQLLWLQRPTWQFIVEHYVPLARDFLVPGGILRGAGVHEWTCIVPGRYYVGSDGGRGSLSVDGRPTRGGVAVLGRGRHAIASSAANTYVVWLGPHLNVPPALGPGEAEQVLVNWY
jgi:hypothetical protein